MDGLIHITRDGGQNWTNVTPRNMPEWMMINSIEPDPHDAGTCYFAGTRYKLGDYAPYIYKTTNYGQSWTRIVNGIKGDHFTRVVRVDPSRKGLLYAGTETGMYISYDDGRQWHPFQMNLPIVPITDLTIKNNDLIAATQGRSFWLIDDLTLIRQLADNQGVGDIHLFKPMGAYRFGGGFSFGSNRTGVGKNHPGGVPLYYYLKDYNEKDTLSISIYESGGDLVRTYFTHAEEKLDKIKDVKAGSSIFNWGFGYPSAKSFEGLIMWAGSLNSQRAIPGEYKAEISLNGKSQSQTFNILADPRLEISQGDYENSFNFVKDINDKITEAHEAIIEIRKVKQYLNKLKTDYGEEEDLKKESNRIDSLMMAIEKELYQTKNKSRQDPLNFPIKLNNKLAHLNALTSRGEYPPTDQAYTVKEELEELIDVQLEAYKKIRESDIPNLNVMIRDKTLDYIKLEDE